MELLKELLPGCFLLKSKRIEDQRGFFVKTYQKNLYEALGLQVEVQEEFYSMSHKNVIRGMHFQLPPYAHDKLVHCICGEVLDVLVDLRAGPGYGCVASAKLSGENGCLVFIPKGVAHGFSTLTDKALMLYKTSTVHVPEFDCGIRWDSIGLDWGVSFPIISDRDGQHAVLSDFKSPF